MSPDPRAAGDQPATAGEADSTTAQAGFQFLAAALGVFLAPFLFLMLQGHDGAPVRTSTVGAALLGIAGLVWAWQRHRMATWKGIATGVSILLAVGGALAWRARALPCGQDDPFCLTGALFGTLVFAVYLLASLGIFLVVTTTNRAQAAPWLLAAWATMLVLLPGLLAWTR